MFDTLVIRAATPADKPAIDRLAALDSARGLDGPVLVSHHRDGEIVAARSLRDGRDVADPFKPTGPVRELLRMSAGLARAA